MLGFNSETRNVGKKKKNERTQEEMSESRRIEDFLDRKLVLIDGSGYIISDRLCIMNSSDGWQLRARLYRSDIDGELCRPKDHGAYEEDGFFLTSIPTYDCLIKLIEFMNTTVKP